MKVRNKVFLLVGLSASIFLVNGYLSHAKEVRGVSDDTIKIGAILDQTGPASSIAMPLTTGIKTYARYINERGGVHGRKLRILAEDDRYSIPAAISAFKKLVYKDEIFALIGPGSASFLPPLWRKFEKEKLPTIVIPFAELAVKPHKKYLFITCDTYEGQIKVITDYMIKNVGLKEPRIGLVYPDTEAGKIDLRAALSRLQEHNIKPVTKEILMAGALDAGSQVMSLKRYKVNCAMNLGTITTTTVTLLRELKNFALKIPVFSSWGAMLGEGINEIGQVADQAYTVHAISPWYGEGPGVNAMRRIILKYHPRTEKPYRGTSYTYGWAAANIMVEGLTRAGRDLDQDSLISSLETLKNYDTGGLLNPVTFSSKSHKGGNSSKVYKADPVRRQYVALTGWIKSD